MWRIAHLSDLHWENPERYFSGGQDALRLTARHVRQALPDLVVVTGDLTTYGSADPAQFIGVRQWLEDLGVPYMVVPGNHDLGANRLRGATYPDTERYHAEPWAETPFARAFGLSEPVSVRRLGPIRIMAVALRDGDPDGSILRLKAALSEEDTPVVILAHYPLETVRTTGPLAVFGADDYIAHSVPALRATLAPIGPRVLYLAGHVHAASVRRLADGITQMTAGGLGPGPSQWWLFHLGESDITYQSQVGAGPQTFWERFGAQLSDSHAYHWGPSADWQGVWAWASADDENSAVNERSI